MTGDGGRKGGNTNKGGPRPQKGKGGSKDGGDEPKGKPSAGRPHPKSGKGGRR